MIRGWAIVVLCGVVLAGFLRLRFDAEPLSLLPQEVPSVAGLRLHQEHFAGGRELVVTVHSPTPEGSLRAAESIAVGLRELTNDVRIARWRVVVGEDSAGKGGGGWRTGRSTGKKQGNGREHESGAATVRERVWGPPERRWVLCVGRSRDAG